MVDKVMVAHITETVRRKIHEIARGGSKAKPSLGSQFKPPYGIPVKVDFHEFVFQLLRRSKVSKTQAAHVLQHAWCRGTIKEHTGVVRRWLYFTEQYNLDPYNLKFDQIMAFMEYIHETEKSFSLVSRTKSLMSVLWKLIGDPFTPGNRYLMDKFVAATFNIDPPYP